MRRPVLASAAVVGATGCLTLAANGLLGAGTDPGGRPGPFGPPSAAAAGLSPFRSCDQLLDWYVAEALPHVGPYGLDGGGVSVPGAVLDRMGMPAQAAEDSADSAAGRDVSSDAVTSSGTGTNVQESGVDEPDVAKTDGDLVVQARDGNLVVTDVSGDEAREVGRLRLPDEMYSPELLLAGERVFVLQSGPRVWGGPMPVDDLPVVPMPMEGVGRSIAPEPATEHSRLLEVSLADPGSPRVESDQTFGGSVVTARQYGEGGASTIRLVLRTGGPALDWVYPNRNRTAREAKEENKEIVRASAIEDWLPTVGTGDDRAPLVDCSDVRHPDDVDGLGTITVLSLPADDATAWRSTAVTASGDTVYSSTDRLYLATWADDDETQLHSFALEDGDARYVASGRVEGSVRDRWSLDEHDGVLRVAVAHGSGWDPSENGVTTLREDGDRLVHLGSVRGLGPDEEIKSVRWFDDLAVVVTFRQTDPLYTVDLSDPARPRTLGALKIPGFSRYLHPIGGDRLLGIGQDASLDGMTRGAQAAVFDIRDLTDPRRLSTAFLGEHTVAAAEDDPRGFTWLPGTATALTPVTDHWHGGSRLVALRVSSSGDLAEVGSWSVPRWDAYAVRALPLDGDRVALVTHDVRVISVPRTVG